MADHRPRIQVTIASHGYGHLSQAAALLRELIKQIPDSIFRIQCNLPGNIIAERLGTDHFEHDPCSMEIGMIQKTPITHDLDASYQAYKIFHENFSEHISREAQKVSTINFRVTHQFTN